MTPNFAPCEGESRFRLRPTGPEREDRPFGERSVDDAASTRSRWQHDRVLASLRRLRILVRGASRPATMPEPVRGLLPDLPYRDGGVVEIPVMLDPEWQRALKDAVRPLLPAHFYGHITINVQGETMGDINVVICLREPKRL